MRKHIRINSILAMFLSFLMFAAPFEMFFANALESVKISVIIPVYNVGKDLDKSLQTVENQTFKDIEIICVNDGSQDNSLEILNEHAQKDSRIRIINQENKGASEARNVGLREAKGEYIYFCDGDDYVLPQTLEKALSMFDVYPNLDAVEFGVDRVDYDAEVDLDDYEYEDECYELLECGEGENPYKVFKTFGWGVWKYLYKKSFLVDNGLEFKKGLRTNEDVLFGFLAMSCMKRVCRYKNIGYIYRICRPDSTTNTICKIHNKRLEGFIEISNEIIANRKRLNFKGSDEHILNFIIYVLYYRLKRTEDNKDKTKYAKIICKDIIENFVDKYKVHVSKSNKKKLDEIKSLANFSKMKKINGSGRNAIKRKNKKL